MLGEAVSDPAKPSESQTMRKSPSGATATAGKDWLLVV